MLVPHPFDIIAILLGLFLALRKSDVRSDDHSRYPSLSLADFDAWQQQALSAYTLGTRACFAKVLLDFGYLALLQRTSFDLTLQRIFGASLDVLWIAALIVVWVRARRARRFIEARGVNLGYDASTDRDASADARD